MIDESGYGLFQDIKQDSAAFHFQRKSFCAYHVHHVS